MPVRPPPLAFDPTVVIDHHRPDDRFNPVAPADLLGAIVADAGRFGEDAEDVREFATALERLIQQEAVAFERDLLTRYTCVNPDRDTLAVRDLAEERTAARYEDLIARLEYLFKKANFTRLGDVDVHAALQAASAHGLRVRLNTERILHLGVWVRGLADVELLRRSWRNPRGVRCRVPVYRRLAVVARLRDDPNVQLKLFKEIPTPDVEALLPHAEVQMNWLDRLKLLGGGAGMAGTTASKLLGLASGALVLSRLLWILAFGAGALCFRTFMGYRNVRARRDLQRTTNLYYQNVANNAGVIHTLTAMITQEEFKEALLVCVFCRAAQQASAGRVPPELRQPVRDSADLAQRIETYLHERFKARFTFDVADACATMQQLQLWGDPKRFHVVPLEEAVKRLRDVWSTCRREGYHIGRARANEPAKDV